MVKFVNDLSKVKPEEISYLGGSIDIQSIIISTRPYREDYAAVVVYVDGGTSACTIDGRLNVGGIQRFIYKPKKVAYVKPLHVILTENRYEVDCYGITIYEDSEGMKLAFPALYTRFFGEPVEDFYRKTPGSYTLNNNFFGIPESWIEYKEEE